VESLLVRVTTGQLTPGTQLAGAGCGIITLIVVSRFWPTVALVKVIAPWLLLALVSEKLAGVATPDTKAVTV
jgi:hypothetical protein